MTHNSVRVGRGRDSVRSASVRAFEEFVETWDEQQRVVYKLRYRYDFRLDEIAGILDLSRDEVTTLLDRLIEDVCRWMDAIDARWSR